MTVDLTTDTFVSEEISRHFLKKFTEMDDTTIDELSKLNHVSAVKKLAEQLFIHKSGHIDMAGRVEESAIQSYNAAKIFYKIIKDQTQNNFKTEEES